MTIELNLGDGAPWKKRYRAPSIAWSKRAANNPERGLVCCNKDGVYQLYAWDIESNDLRQLTDAPAGVVSGHISIDGDSVYYLRDSGGDEIGHYARLPFSGGAAQDLTPHLPAYASHFFSMSAGGNALGFTAAAKEGFQILLYDNPPVGEPLFSYRTTALSAGPFLSHDAEIAIVASTEKTGVAELALAAYDVASGDVMAELWDGAGSGIEPARFSPLAGDARFAGSSNAGGFHRPLIWDPRSGARLDIQSERFQGDVQVWDWSPDGARLLLHQVHQALHSLFVYDIVAEQVIPLNAPPGSAGAAGYFAENGNIFLHWSDAAKPSSLIEIDGASGDYLRDVIDLEADLPASAPWRSVRYSSGDGAPIQAWLATPPGEGPFPTIVHTHGGPTAVQTNAWSPSAQTWLDHGFAFFSLNYRGSTTFGYDFQHAIDGNLGELEVEDIAAGVGWLIDNGIADPGAILKTGASYGGYLTLLSLGKRPELWAGGMAMVAIADWTLMYEDQAGTLRGYQRSLFGGSPEEKPDAHKKSSPITYAENFQADLLVIQGANDTRCPARQMRVFESMLKDLGKSIDVRWFDAGHGSRAIEQSIEHQELMLRFAAKVLS
ncbi:MAG: prolyl oligopeptidase family serine peptidase [Chloroflexi bacterium]|nr:prolyl oligopeptidase family serine peptidase [Chloroflexota bacterium]